MLSSKSGVYLEGDALNDVAPASRPVLVHVAAELLAVSELASVNRLLPNFFSFQSAQDLLFATAPPSPGNLWSMFHSTDTEHWQKGRSLIGFVQHPQRFNHCIVPSVVNGIRQALEKSSLFHYSTKQRSLPSHR